MTYSDEQLSALLEGLLSSEEEARLAVELETQPPLQERLARLSGELNLEAGLREARQTTPLPPVPKEVIERAIRLLGTPQSPLSRFDATDGPGPLPDLAGQIGGFTIVRRIAHGGMGTVYLARDPALGREVAIKVVQSAAAADPVVHERFLREARALADIDHPHVLPVYQIVGDADPPFMVMRLAEGGTLQDRLDRAPGTPLPLEDILPIATAMASALEAVHARGCIHRDVKPSNILLGKQPWEIWLSDFGLVRDGQARSLTLTHAFVGTPQYMSPEHAAGTPVLPQSDLFSLGTVLYTLATGQPPFHHEDFDELRRLVREERPAPLDRAASHLPAWLRHLIESLLIKDPARRPQSATAVLQTLASKSDGGAAPSRLLWGIGTRRRRALRHFATAIAVSVAAVVAALIFTEQTGRTHVVNGLLAARTGEPIWIAGDWGTYPSLEDAVAAATAATGPRSTPVEIVLHTDELVRFSHLHISRPLLLRASRGRTPLLLAVDSPDLPRDETHILITAPLTLRDITVHQRPPSYQFRPLFTLQGGSLVLEHCRIVRPARANSARRSIRHGLITLTGSSLVHISHSELVALGSSAVVCDDVPGSPSGTPARPTVDLVNSRVFGRFISLRGALVHASLKTRSSVLASHQIFEQQQPGSTLTVQIQQSILHASRQLARADRLKLDDGTPWLQWQGQGNALCVQGDYMVAADGTALPDFKTWQDYLHAGGGASHAPLLITQGPVDLDQIKEVRLYAGERFVVTDLQPLYGSTAPALIAAEHIGPRFASP